mgnify:CR=1 FL=1
MCELYVKADPILYESRSRSLRIRGVVTTLRLENQFWDILQEIAEVDGMTTNQLITKLYDEVMEQYMKELAAIHGLFDQHKAKPLIYENYPPVAGAIAWAACAVDPACLRGLERVSRKVLRTLSKVARHL